MTKAVANRKPDLKREIMIRRVIAYIQSNGGSVPHTIRTLELDISTRSVYAYAKRHDIELTSYKYARRRYGDWIINAVPAISASLNDFIVNATCMLCGQSKDVHLSNLRSGKSKCCKPCALKRKRTFDVVSLSTNNRYNSIRQFHKEVDTDNSYQQIRKLLLDAGSVVVDGVEYFLLPKAKVR